MQNEKRHAFCKSSLTVREDAADKYIEGYFAVFDAPTELFHGYIESIAKGAFANSLKNNDIRCLFNHDMAAVLGRMSNNTLELSEDEKGLFGRVKINPADSDALNTYAKVQRGDISGCSFGFYPVEEKSEIDDDGTYRSTIIEADTWEVSICTFPAYEQTEIQARHADADKAKERLLSVRKEKIREKIGGIEKCLNN